eukprot:TRINITY_DN34356_c0_g1_i1.p1 TRINITY_DN34356_c0_g1~~TRINITY_DN34356_c0_g1_i1.p1  ORF type:complete len:211 (+),score=32.87 TRINITY_DN34356_c0_g1_i1:127-759(+)
MAMQSTAHCSMMRLSSTTTLVDNSVLGLRVGQSVRIPQCFKVNRVSANRHVSRGIRAEVSESTETIQNAVDSTRGETKSVGLQRKGILAGGRWLSCTTRHIRIYVGYIDPDKLVMDQSQMDKLSIMVDPDNEFLWPEETLQRVFDEFAELVDSYAGADCTEYTLRLIGSDLEHFIRKMLLAGEIQYNLDSRVLNFSMGKPRYEGLDVEAS